MESSKDLSEFQQQKVRIDNALAFLRDQLRELRQQDVTLLRHMMQIHCTINALAGRQGVLKRSYSSGHNLHSSISDMGLLNATSSPHLAPPPHTSLSRHQSGPIREQTASHSVERLGQEEEDLRTRSMSWSCNSLGDLSRSCDGSFSNSLSVSVTALPPCLRGTLEAITEVGCEGQHHHDSEGSEGGAASDGTPASDGCPWELQEDSASAGSVFSSGTEGEPTYPKIVISSSQNGHHHAGEEQCSDAARCQTELICVPSRDIVVHSGVIVPGEHHCSVGSSSPDSADMNGFYMDSPCSLLDTEGVNGAEQLVPEALSRKPHHRRCSRLEQYEVPYEDMLRRSSKLWREIQQEHTDTGKVDARKMMALKLFL